MIWKKKTTQTTKSKEPKKKAKKDSVRKTFADLCPIRDYDTVNDIYICNDNSIIDFFKFRCRDLVVANENEIDLDINCLINFMRQYSIDCKIISVNVPVNCSVQKKHLLHKIDTTTNVYEKAMLQKKLAEDEWLEKNRLNKEYYLMVFASNLDAYNTQKKIILSCLAGSNSVISEVDYDTKQELIFKLNNKCVSQLNEFSYIPDNNGIIKNCLAETQTKGNISFKAVDYIRTGSGYETCLEVYDYPASVDRHWMSSVCDVSHAITIIDIHTENFHEVKGNLNRSIKEQKARANVYSDAGDVSDAANEYAQLLELYEDLSQLKKILKSVTIRIFMFAKTKDELEKRVSETISKLDAYKCCIYLNEMEWAFKSMYLPYQTQQKIFPIKRYGQCLVDEAVACGNPFHFNALSDPYGTYLATTTSGGVVQYYHFTKTKTRTYYNALITGDMGSGKSTLLKKIGHDCYIQGDILRIFDPMDEWYGLAPIIGGKIINMDGSDGILNMFEILRTAEEDTMSFMQHLAKLNINYRLLNATCNEQEIAIFERTVSDFYAELNIMVPGLPSTSYPTLYDFVMYLKKKIDNFKISDNETKSVIDKKEIDYIHNIYLIFSRLLQNYASIFNGHTSISNLASHRCVVFNIKNIFTLPEEISDIILYNTMSLCWDNCTQNGQIMKRMYEDGKIKEEDIVHFLIEFDEFHHIVNGNKTTAINQIAIMLREMRKLYGGMIMSTQRIKDLLPTNTSAKATAQITSLFEFCNLKFIGHQDNNSVQTIKEAFGKSLTEAELDNIPKLSMGQFILNMSGNDGNLSINVYADNEELQMFKGGM